MATFVLTDASVTINSVDLSDHVTSVNIDYGADEAEDTAMGDTTHQFLAGLLDWTATVEFVQDFAANEVDATLFSLVGAAAFAIAIRPTSAATSATNPEFQMNGILTSYPPIANSIGETATTTAVFRPAGAITRATS